MCLEFYEFEYSILAGSHNKIWLFEQQEDMKEFNQSVVLEEEKDQKIVDIKSDSKKKIYYCIYPKREVKMLKGDEKVFLIQFQMCNSYFYLSNSW